MKRLSSATIRVFRRTVLNHYKKNGRDLPWRHTIDPYFILVSEIMLQQTQAPRVIGKYRQFINQFPTIKSLAKAPLAQVLQLWQGLGYNRRAIGLHRTAQVIDSTYRGKMPTTIDQLRDLPGIGPYTAAAVRVFAFNQPALLIETNIRSVYIYYFFNHYRRQIADIELIALIEQTQDYKNPKQWYHALMDYGAMLKSTYGNPSKKSKHYTKQTKFDGSNRQLRGQIVKLIIEKKRISLAQCQKKLNFSRLQIETALQQLISEGLIKKNNHHYIII